MYDVTEFSTYCMFIILAVDKSYKKVTEHQYAPMASTRLILVEIEANMR